MLVLVLLVLLLLLHDRPQVRCCPTDGRKQGKARADRARLDRLVT